MTVPPQGPFKRPITAAAVDGEVAITGPGHIHGSMTPKAAKRSAERLKDVADTAEQQTPADGDEAAGGRADG